MENYWLHAKVYIGTCVLLIVYMIVYYGTVIADILQGYAPDKKDEDLDNWLVAGAAVYMLLGFWRLIVQLSLTIYFGRMGMRFFKRLSDEVDSWFWKKNWRKAFLTLLAVFYIGASLKDCLLLPLLVSKVLMKTAQ